jgi:hypothetical protein
LLWVRLDGLARAEYSGCADGERGWTGKNERVQGRRVQPNLPQTLRIEHDT